MTTMSSESHFARKLMEGPRSESPDSVCAVIGCNNTARSNPGVIFYKFPKKEMNRLIWSCLLGRVDTASQAWVPTPDDSVCHDHFLGNRRIMCQGIPYFHPSVFPAIEPHNCIVNADGKLGKFPRPAGYYTHRIDVASDSKASIVVEESQFPERSPSRLTWDQLDDIAYKQIFQPFMSNLDKFFEEESSKGDTRLKKIVDFIAQMADQRHTFEGIESESSGEGSPPQPHLRRPESPCPVEPSRKRTKTKAVQAVPSRLKINLSLPSIVSDKKGLNLPILGQKQTVFIATGPGFCPWKLRVIDSIDYGKNLIRLLSDEKTIFYPFERAAYGEYYPNQIMLGCRVVSQLNENDPDHYPGVIVEYPKLQNRRRYLVLFENGCWRHVKPDKLHLICKQFVQPWAVVDDRISKFLKVYFSTTERPLLRVSVGNIIQAERQREYLHARVLTVDGNLIELEFLRNNQRVAVEWVYAGSKRLHNISMFMRKDHNSHKIARRRTNKKCGAYIEFADDARDFIELSDDEEEEAPPESPPTNGTDHLATDKKNTARKTCTAVHIPSPAISKKSLRSNIKDVSFLGSVYLAEAGSQWLKKAFVPHACSDSCSKIDPSMNIRRYNPYFAPMMAGWYREVITLNRVQYTTPCGRAMKDSLEVFKYLRETGSDFTIDFFSFDRELDVRGVWKPDRQFSFREDISDGTEPCPISVVNSVDHMKDNLVPYWAKRQPSKSVAPSLNLDPEFLSCCSCTDDCLDKTKCECQLQTTAASRLSDDGYEFRSLKKHSITGIFECNAKCACSKRCINKVAQNGVSLRLQLFKTSKKGYGVRTLHDIPKGRFVCTYAGTILSDKEAEESGQDTYFAELDYLDICASHKEGYESSCTDIEDDSSDDSEDYLEDGDNEEPRMGKKRMDGYALRQLYYGKEGGFVMDAIHGGNIGRYFNHSCEPNIFVQNVFVDTLDLRFPWIAFFTDRLIKAGEELTWDYRYEVGSVSGKKLFCYCGSKQCRKRLL